MEAETLLSLQDEQKEVAEYIKKDKEFNVCGGLYSGALKGDMARLMRDQCNL